jgi:hypothetical protein
VDAACGASFVETAGVFDVDCDSFESEEVRCRALRRQEQETFGIRWHKWNCRAITPQCRWQLFEERSGRTLDERRGRFLGASRNEKFEFVTSMGLFANDDFKSPRR